MVFLPTWEPVFGVGKDRPPSLGLALLPTILGALVGPQKGPKDGTLP